MDARSVVFYVSLAIVLCFLLFPSQSFDVLFIVREKVVGMVKSAPEDTTAPPPVKESTDA